MLDKDRFFGRSWHFGIGIGIIDQKSALLS